MWLNLEITLDKRRQKVGLVTRRELKKVIALQRAMTIKKVVSFFQGKIGITPSVAAPGDTNPSDATGRCHLLHMTRSCHEYVQAVIGGKLTHIFSDPLHRLASLRRFCCVLNAVYKCSDLITFQMKKLMHLSYLYHSIQYIFIADTYGDLFETMP